jgi:phosphatidylserine synthase
MIAGLVGALLIVAGALILAELDWTQQELGTEQSFGWVPIGFGALTLIAAYAFPAKTRRVTEIR